MSGLRMGLVLPEHPELVSGERRKFILYSKWEKCSVPWVQEAL